MKRLPVLIINLLFRISIYSQITIINTGSSDNLTSIFTKQKKVLICGSKTYLSKCYGDCNSLTPLTVPFFPNSSYVFRLDPIDSSNFYMSAATGVNNNYTIWKSISGGISCAKKFETTSLICNPYWGGYFDSSNGIYFTDNYNTLVTSNGLNNYSFGQSWFGSSRSYAKVFGDSTVIASDIYGGIGISNNRGKTWPNELGYSTGINTPINFEFLNKDTFFFITTNTLQFSGFYSTFNGGKTWNRTSFDDPNMNQPKELRFRIYAKNRSEIYLTARGGATGSDYIGNGLILKSTDLGKTWSTCTIPIKENFYDMKFINDSVALVCGSNGILFKWNSKAALFTEVKENLINELDLYIFPNPIKDNFRLNVSQSKMIIQKLRISNALGQSVYEIIYPIPQSEFDISFLPSGIYYLKVETKDKQKVFKILKE